jgi:hypothetical protein
MSAGTIIALTILAGLLITAVLYVRDTYRNPVEDDPDQITDDEYLATLAMRVGRVSSFDHDRSDKL